MLLRTYNNKPVEERLCVFCAGMGRKFKPLQDRSERQENQINKPKHWPRYTEIMDCAVCWGRGRYRVYAEKL